MVKPLLDGVAAHGAWAGPLFGLLAFGESLAVVGTIIPATPFLFLIGTMLGSGQLDPRPVLPCAMAGAVAGYWLSWSAGRRLGPAVYRRRLLAGQRRGIARARLFFRRWGGPSLIFGRILLGPFHSMLPLVAGAAAMSARRFHGWNIASGIIWVLVVLAPGYLAAQGITVFGIGVAQQRGLIAILLGVSVALAVAAVGMTLFRFVRVRP